jgi:3-dehydroquinate synthase
MPSAREIIVRLPPGPQRAYSICIEQGCLEKLPRLLPARGERIFIVTDSRVRRLYGRGLLRRLTDVGLPAIMIDFPAGEGSKNAGVLSLVQTALLEGGLRRDSVVLALGGGVVGDLAGFAAATALRGVTLIQVPTTLLAQVDSSVGGKVGVDHPAGKNLLGAFYQPSAVYIDPSVLDTLPDREFRNGLAEVVKIALALDPRFFRWIEQHRKELRGGSPLVRHAIEQSVRLKALVVEKDERDASVRQSLNLGHTIGHALEAASGYALRHGFAVSIGLAAEATLARRMGYLSGRDLGRIVALLRVLRLPWRFPRLRNRATFFGALGVDKKSTASGLRFTLPAGIGCCALGVDVPHALIEELAGEGR